MEHNTIRAQPKNLALCARRNMKPSGDTHSDILIIPRTTLIIEETKMRQKSLLATRNGRNIKHPINGLVGHFDNCIS